MKWQVKCHTAGSGWPVGAPGLQNGLARRNGFLTGSSESLLPVVMSTQGSEG